MDESQTMSDTIQPQLDALPPYMARGVKLITDQLDKELMLNIVRLPHEAQLQFWLGAYMGLCSNIKSATTKEVLRAIVEEYHKQD